MFIDATTSRQELLAAINDDINLVEAFIQAGLSEEASTTEEIRNFIISWIEAGDECRDA